MVEITNRDELETWLRNRPREDAVLIAARATLRVFPLLVPVIDENAADTPFTNLLPVCRALEVAIVAGTWPTLAIEVRDAARAARAAYVAHADAAAYAAAAVYAADAVYAARAAVDAAANAAADIAYSNAVTDATSDAARVANAAAEAAYAALSTDATDLEEGGNHAAVAGNRIWRGRPLRFPGIGRIGRSSKPPDEIGRAWIGLKNNLERAGDHWQVWVDWYQGCLDGKPARKDLQLAKALIPNEVWDAGPAVANIEIARLNDKFAAGEDKATDDAAEVEAQEPASDSPATDGPFALPQPRPAPVQMSVDDGVLQIIKPGSKQIEEIARDGWAALCEEIDEVARQLDGKNGNNELLPHLMRARHTLGDGFDDFNVIRFGLAALTIEQFAQEAESLGMLMPEHAAPLRSIVLQKNLLLAHSPGWAAYTAAIEPPIADAETEQEAANLAVEINREITVEHGDAVAPEAQQLLEELASATQAQPSPDNPEGIASPEARRSLLRAFSEEMRAFALDIIAEYRKLVVKGTAASAATGSIAVVTSVSTKLLGLADKLPQEYAWLKDLVYYAASLVGV